MSVLEYAVIRARITGQWEGKNVVHARFETWTSETMSANPRVPIGDLLLQQVDGCTRISQSKCTSCSRPWFLNWMKSYLFGGNLHIVLVRKSKLCHFALDSKASIPSPRFCNHEPEVNVLEVFDFRNYFRGHRIHRYNDTLPADFANWCFWFAKLYQVTRYLRRVITSCWKIHVVSLRGRADIKNHSWRW